METDAGSSTKSEVLHEVSFNHILSSDHKRHKGQHPPQQQQSSTMANDQRLENGDSGERSALESNDTNNNVKDEVVDEDEEMFVRRKSKRLKNIRKERKEKHRESSKLKIRIEQPEGVDENVENEEEDDIQIDYTKLPPFQPIEENLFLFYRKKPEKNHMECDCSLTREEKKAGFRGCQEDCLNRMVLMECDANCSLGKRCGNRRFQKKEYARIQPFKTAKKGYGLMALENLDHNVFVMEYVGEVIDAFEFHGRVEQYAKDKIEHHYFMSLKTDEIIDATKMGNITRFINHSCEPNCTTQKWMVRNELRIGFFTIKPIKKGEELTFDYQFQRYGKKAQKCYCGTPSCRGFIGSSSSGPNILTDGTKIKIEDSVPSPSDSACEVSFEDIIEEFYESYCDGGLESKEDVQELMRAIVGLDVLGTDLEYLLKKVVAVLLATKTQSYLKLLVDYRFLILFWGWMKSIDNLELIVDFLKLLKVFPIENRNILKDNKILPLVQRWATHTPFCSTDEEHFLKKIQVIANDLLKVWDRLPEAAVVPKSLKIKMRKSDEQKAESEGLKTAQNNNQEDKLTRRKKIRHNLRKSKQDTYEIDRRPTYHNEDSYSRHDSMMVEDVRISEQDQKQREKHRKAFEAKIAQQDYKQAMEKYAIENAIWKKNYACDNQLPSPQSPHPLISTTPAALQQPQLSSFQTLQAQKVLQVQKILQAHPPLQLFPPPPIREEKPVVEISPKTAPVEERLVEERKEVKEDPKKGVKSLLEAFENFNFNVDESEYVIDSIVMPPFKDERFAHYRHIYDGDTPFMLKSSSSSKHFFGKENLTNLVTLQEASSSENLNTLSTELIDCVPLKEIDYEDRIFFDSVEKIDFDQTYPKAGAYFQDSGANLHIPETGDIRSVLTIPHPPQFDKIPLKSIPKMWKIHKTSQGQYFYHNALLNHSQWFHPPAEIEAEMADVESESNHADTTNDSEDVSPEVVNHKLSNQKILKLGDQRTKERLERQKRRNEEVIFKKIISKYVVKLLTPHLSVEGKRRKIATKDEFKKIAAKFTDKIVDTEIATKKDKKLVLTEVIKTKIKAKIKEYLKIK